MANSNTGFVSSSDRSKVYTVYINLARREAFSDDNGTRYRGYIGYPIIAVLMASGHIAYDDRYAEALSGIPWKRLNEYYKKYSIVEKLVEEHAKRRGIDIVELRRYVNNVMKKLEEYRLRALENAPLEASLAVYKCRDLFKRLN